MGIVPFQRRAAPDDPASEFAATVAFPVADTGVAAPASASAGADVVLDLDTEGGDATHIGRYALRHKLGEGGLGTVHEAWDPLLSRTVAIKTLQLGTAASAHGPLDDLFLHEARLAAGLDHPNIVTIFDAGLSRGGIYIAMERLQGRDLRQALRDGWQPTPLQAALLVRRVADGLAYAHAKGVVHCDVKPANIFLGRKDKPKLLDFGIARVIHGPDAARLAAADGMIAGSPYYLAPEQLQGGTIDERTDVYALGVVLYELLAGCKPFDGDSLDAITHAVLHHDPAPPHALRPEVPEVLSALAMTAMARVPAQRPANAAALAHDLRRWLEAQDDDHGGDAVRPAVATAPADAAVQATPARRARWLGWVLAAPAVAALLWLAAGSRETPAPVAPTSTAPAAPAPTIEPAPTTPAAAGTTTSAPAPERTTPAAKAPATTAPPSSTKPRPGGAATPAAATPERDLPATLGTAAAAPATGTVQLAISPWGEVEVDGKPAGTTPPLTRLTLPAGKHTITVRNSDFPPHAVTVTVEADQASTVRHRFGP